jgi:hypothetical protein
MNTQTDETAPNNHAETNPDFETLLYRAQRCIARAEAMCFDVTMDYGKWQNAAKLVDDILRLAQRIRILSEFHKGVQMAPRLAELEQRCPDAEEQAERGDGDAFPF